MSPTDLKARKRLADRLADLRERHERLLNFIRVDEDANDCFHEELRADLGILIHCALHGADRA